LLADIQEKKMRSIAQCCRQSALAGALLLGSIGAAQAVVMPEADCGLGPTNNCLTFGDFNVYSLPLLNQRAGYDTVPSPGDPFYASSTYGAIKDYTIIGINNGQYTQTGNPTGQVDGSYDTPSPNNATSTTFSTRTTTDPGGAGEFAGDVLESWDAQVSSLLTLSGGTPLTFFFAFNETGRGTGLENTDLLIWGRATLVNTNSGASQSFYLGGNTGASTPLQSALPSPTGFDADPNTQDFGPWVYVHAGVCVDGVGNFIGFPDNAGACPFGTELANQNNLGQNAAAFMVNSPDLDAALESGLYDALQITWEMAYINGGGETAWSMPVTAERNVPEPRGLVLAATAMLLLALNRYLRRA
jgi:hypothetical protein